jgi:hypothetical protein
VWRKFWHLRLSRCDLFPVVRTVGTQSDLSAVAASLKNPPPGLKYRVLAVPDLNRAIVSQSSMHSDLCATPPVASKDKKSAPVSGWDWGLGRCLVCLWAILKDTGENARPCHLFPVAYMIKESPLAIKRFDLFWRMRTRPTEEHPKVARCNL